MTAQAQPRAGPGAATSSADHRVAAVHVCATRGGFFYDDQEAIGAGAVPDGHRYLGTPRTAGFATIRQPAAALSIGLELADGRVAWGEGTSVQYAGAAGRDPLFDAARWARDLGERATGKLVGLDVSGFRRADASGQALLEDLGLTHTALRYGFSQAVLGACASATGRTMVKVLCDEYSLDLRLEPVPIYTQSGDDRLRAVDRMILKRADVLPHGLINNREKFGPRGETLLEYVRWVAARVQELAPADYRPVLNFDVYGGVGAEFGLSVAAIADFLVRVEAAARPFAVRVESPADFGDRGSQVEGFRELRALLGERGSRLEIVADEWCNTLEDVELFASAGAGHMLQVKVPDLGSVDESVKAVLACHDQGMGVFLGGSCSETDLSARVCAHVALATRPAFQLAKPGMGVDEALMIVGNEQARVLSVLRASASESERAI